MSYARKIDPDTLAKVLAKLRYPPIKQIAGQQSGASWFEPDYVAHATNIAREYAALAAVRKMR